jgi:hypothetical protein
VILHRAAIAAVAICLLATGCGADLKQPLHPGDAVVVAGEHISIETVDELALAMCELEKPGLAEQSFAVPMAFVRSLAAESLATDVLLEEFAAEQGIDLEEVRRGVREEAKAVVAEVPADLRAAAEDRIAIEGVRRAVLSIAGSGGDPEADPEKAAEQGRILFAEFREGADLVRDPRFGDVDLDTFAFSGGNGSLSINTDARAAEGGPLDQAAVAELPDDQRCGTVPEQTPATQP